MEIKEILATFGIEKTNNGASTGSEWINTKGEQIDSYSPVDGSLIAVSYTHLTLPTKA